MPQYSGIPITQLTPASQAMATDVYVAVDTTDLTQSPVGTTKKYTLAQLQTFMVNEFTGSNKQTVRASTTGNLNAAYLNGTAGVGATLTNAGTLGAFTADGQAMVAGDRVLVSFQSLSFQNGIYEVLDAGDVGTPWVLIRADDFDGSPLGEIRQGDFVGVLFGNLYGTTFWFVTSTTPIAVGTSPITFQQQNITLEENWVITSGPTQQMAVNTGYTVNGNTTLTLPPTSSAGEWVEINGTAGITYVIAQNAGQVCYFSGIGTTTPGVTGSITNAFFFSAIKLRCITANTEWEVVYSSGSFTIV